jgi:hypothetical protein
MKSSTSTAFRKQFAALGPEVQRLARKKFRPWFDGFHGGNMRVFVRLSQYFPGISGIKFERLSATDYVGLFGNGPGF